MHLIEVSISLIIKQMYHVGNKSRIKSQTAVKLSQTFICVIWVSVFFESEVLSIRNHQLCVCHVIQIMMSSA